VDFKGRERLLDAQDADFADMLSNWQDGRIKLVVTTRALHLRRELPQVFVGGEYVPLTVEASVPGDAVAFARVSGNDAVLAIAPRLCGRMVVERGGVPLGGDAWKTSRVMLPEALRGRTYRHVFTGAEIRPVVTSESGWIFLGQAFDRLPVALLRAT
jgi:(1->4)-alpha-D-glucan 1-alpha-D-glucosylmutase